MNRGGLTGKPVEELTEKDNDWMHEEMLKLCHGKEPGNHMKNFFECVKDRGKTDFGCLVAPPFGQRLPSGQYRHATGPQIDLGSRSRKTSSATKKPAPWSVASSVSSTPLRCSYCQSAVFQGRRRMMRAIPKCRAASQLAEV